MSFASPSLGVNALFPRLPLKNAGYDNLVQGLKNFKRRKREKKRKKIGERPTCVGPCNARRGDFGVIFPNLKPHVPGPIKLCRRDPSWSFGHVKRQWAWMVGSGGGRKAHRGTGRHVCSLGRGAAIASLVAANIG